MPVSTDACVSLVHTLLMIPIVQIGFGSPRFGNAMVTAAQVANGVGEQAWSVGFWQSGKLQAMQPWSTVYCGK